MRWIELDRSKIKVYGKPLKTMMKGMTAQEEHTHFLHSLLTNNVKNLKDGSFNYNLWLRQNGQPLGDFFVYRIEDHFLLDTEKDAKEVIARFEELKLSLRVYFEDLSAGLMHFFVFGEGSSEFIKDAFGVVPEEFKFIKKDGVLIASNPLRIGEEGYDIITGESSLPLPADRQVSSEEFEDLRIRRGIPRIGKELREGFSPVEAGMVEHAIDMNKGCYVGQEAVARVFYRGRTPRKLVKMEAEGRIEEGSELFNDEGKKVGVITSVASDGRRAIAYILSEEAGKGSSFYVGSTKVKIIE